MGMNFSDCLLIMALKDVLESDNEEETNMNDEEKLVKRLTDERDEVYEKYLKLTEALNSTVFDGKPIEKNYAISQRVHMRDYIQDLEDRIQLHSNEI